MINRKVSALTPCIAHILNVSKHKMKIKLLIIFLLVFNLAYSQVKDTLSVSALKLTKQEVTYDPDYSFQLYLVYSYITIYFTH